MPFLYAQSIEKTTYEEVERYKHPLRAVPEEENKIHEEHYLHEHEQRDHRNNMGSVLQRD